MQYNKVSICLPDREKNANRKTRLKTFSKQYERGEWRNKFAESDCNIVNNVIVIGSNNHTLISCVCVCFVLP